MAGRRSILLTPEGGYYLFVALFIVGGAILREINLLMLMAGLLVAPLVLQWRMLRYTLRALELARSLPRRVHAGRPFNVRVAAMHHGRRFGTRALSVEDRMCRLPDTSRQATSKVEVLFPLLPPQQWQSETYEVTLPRRGRYRYGPLRAVTRFPLGLLRGTLQSPAEAELVVWPAVGRLTPAWRRLVESHRFGSRRSGNRQGLLEGDFYGLREWRPGDSTRWIHWRTSARLGGLAVRQFEQQRHRDLSLVLDLYLPPEPSAGDRSRIEWVVSMAATVVSDLCRRGGSRLVCATAGRTRALWAAHSSTALAEEILDELAACDGSPDVDPRGAWAEVQRRSPPGTRTIILSTRPPCFAFGPATARESRDVAPRTLWLAAGTEKACQYFNPPDGLSILAPETEVTG